MLTDGRLPVLRVSQAILGVMWLVVAACDDGQERRTAATAPAGVATATGTPVRATAVTPAPASATAGATVTVTPTPLPSATTTATRVPYLALSGAATLPPDVALIVQMGCSQCDGPPVALVRLYLDGRGMLRTDTLIRHPEGGRNQPYISSLVVADGGYEMAVTLCSRGYCGGLAAVTADAETTVLRSRDGGITWQDLERRPGAYGVVAAGPEGVYVAGPYETSPRGIPLRLLPGDRRVLRPPGAEDGHPVPAGSQLLWQTFQSKRVLRADGSALFEVTDANGYITTVLPDPDSDRVALSWWDGQTSYLTLLEGSGRQLQTFRGSGGFFYPGTWLDRGRLLGNMYVPAAWLPGGGAGFWAEQLPSIVDLATGATSPITEPFLQQPYFNGRNFIEAVTPGPLVRVVTPGSCLNVREQPDARAPVLACVADRVMLRNAGVAREVAGVSWWEVRLPDGRTGWASAAFLER